MKTLLLLTAFCLSLCVSVSAQTTNIVTTNVVKVPVGEEIPIAWDYPIDPEVVTFKIYSFTNVIRTFAVTNLTILGTTNKAGVTNTIYKAFTPSFSKGTEMLTVSAVDSIGQVSDPSNIQPLKALGKPSPPSALRTP